MSLIESSSTRIQEFVNGGLDTVYTSASSFSTAGQVEVFHMMYGAVSLTTGNTANTVYANAHDNILQLDGGDDFAFGFEGDDSISGGTGFDTAVFDGDLADFGITYAGSGTTIVVTDQSGNGQGADTLTDVEALQFNDQTVAVDSLGFFV